ncbi:MAG: hypothetical protein HFG12_10430 [Oscillibacter sp.]|nr:hypothetical protein [Oscillibacter sp.]
MYPETARHYRTSHDTVERNIRYLSMKAWKNAPERLSQMAGVKLNGAPPPSASCPSWLKAWEGGGA